MLKSGVTICLSHVALPIDQHRVLEKLDEPAQ